MTRLPGWTPVEGDGSSVTSSRLLMAQDAQVHVWRCLECLRVLGRISGRGNLLIPSGKELTMCKSGVFVPCDCGKGRLWEFRTR